MFCFSRKKKEAACLDTKNKASKSVYDKIAEKVEKKICTDDTLDKVSCTPKVNKSKDKSKQISTDSKKKVLFLPRTKTEESNENKKIQSDESKICYAVPTPMNNIKKKIRDEKSCPDNSTLSIPNEKNTNAVSAPKSGEVIHKPILSSKKSNRKKSRIESQLEIDMVEGHPIFKVKSAKRLTRNAIVNNPLNRKRLSFNADNNKLKRKGTTKAENKTKDKENSILIKDTPNSEDISASQDFIESSQESTVTTISVQSPKPIGNKIARVVVSPLEIKLKHAKSTTNATEMNTQNLLDVPVTETTDQDKVLPDKRDRSPPREEVCAKNTSPSSSMSLKKNRPQMRPRGRAAQMLELCVPDRLQTVIASEKPADIKEVKRSPSINTSARRNLRILYNKSDDTEDSESFLKLKRTLPTIDCSPGGPILKRKIIDLTDETTASPASKKKRVSFHEPLSTTVFVKKYIAPIGNRSIKQVSEEITPTIEAAMSESTVLEAATSFEVESSPSVETMQTERLAVTLASSQTDAIETSHIIVQTDETRTKSTADIITDCIAERSDFIERLLENIDEPSKKKIVQILMDKICKEDGERVLSIVQDQLIERFESKDLILLCSGLLKKAYDKPA